MAARSPRKIQRMAGPVLSLGCRQLRDREHRRIRSRRKIGPRSDRRDPHLGKDSVIFLPMTSTPICVYIIDDEPSVCTAYARLVRSAKMWPRTFASVEDFLAADCSDENACVVSDVQ